MKVLTGATAPSAASSYPHITLTFFLSRAGLFLFSLLPSIFLFLHLFSPKHIHNLPVHQSASSRFIPSASFPPFLSPLLFSCWDISN